MRHIPECPQFETITVGGVQHVLTPSSRSLDDFLAPAMEAQGLRHWRDGGAVDEVMPTVKAWWPEPECPVCLTVEDEDTGEEYPRWPEASFGQQPDELRLLTAHPQDAEDIRAYCEWRLRRHERWESLFAVRAAVEAAGKLRRHHVLQDVVADLERQAPGLVGRLVSVHCADGHVCDMAEHDDIMSLADVTPEETS